MKNLILLTAFCILAGFQSLSGQTITAGLTTGSNVVYIDPVDIQLSCTTWYSNSQDIDINQDGSSDMVFQASYYYFSHLMVQGTQTDIVPSAFTQLSKIDSLEYSIRQHQRGDTINGNLFWNSSEMGIFNNYSSTGNQEYFTNEGYIGFRICNADTIYGWIYAAATGTYTFAELTIYDYAYINTNSLKEQDTEFKLKNPYLVNDDLIVKITEKDFNNSWLCSIYDFSGRLMQERKVVPGENQLNMSAYTRGIYIVVIQEKEGTKGVFKIAVQ